jgi:hypothetical protein
MLGPHGQSAGGCVRVVRGRALSRGPDGTWFDGRKWAVSVIEHSNILWCDGSNDKGNVRLCFSLMLMLVSFFSYFLVLPSVAVL